MKTPDQMGPGVPEKPMLEKYDRNPPYVSETDDQVFIEGMPSQTKSDFFRIMEKRVVYLDRAEYELKFPYSGLAHFDAELFKTDHGKRINNPVIYVNKDAFLTGNEDYSDLMPIVIRHEIAELWTYAKTGFSLSPKPPTMDEEKRKVVGHGLALRKEYEYAFELGKADRYLQFVINQADNLPYYVVAENQEAYELAKERRQRSLDRSKRNSA